MLLLSMILQALCDFDMYLWQASPKCKRLLWLLFPFRMFLLSKWLHNLTTNQNVSVECFQLPCKVCVCFFSTANTHSLSSRFTHLFCFISSIVPCIRIYQPNCRNSFVNKIKLGSSWKSDAHAVFQQLRYHYVFVMYPTFDRFKFKNCI